MLIIGETVRIRGVVAVLLAGVLGMSSCGSSANSADLGATGDGPGTPLETTIAVSTTRAAVGSGESLIELLRDMPILSVSRQPFAPRSVEQAMKLSTGIVEGTIVRSEVVVADMGPGSDHRGVEALIRFTVDGTKTSIATGESTEGEHTWGFIASTGEYEEMVPFSDQIRARVDDVATGSKVALVGRINPRHDTFYVVAGLIEGTDGEVTGAALLGDDPVGAGYATAEEAAVALVEQVQ